MLCHYPKRNTFIGKVSTSRCGSVDRSMGEFILKSIIGIGHNKHKDYFVLALLRYSKYGK